MGRAEDVWLPLPSATPQMIGDKLAEALKILLGHPAKERCERLAEQFPLQRELDVEGQSVELLRHTRTPLNLGARRRSCPAIAPPWRP